MNTVIVTGCTGFLGQNLLPHLFKKDAKFFIFSSSPSIKNKENIELVKCNLLDQDDVSEKVSALKATHLMHLAWGMEPSNYNLPINFDWIKASIHLLEEFTNSGGKRALISGTGVEYDWSFGQCNEATTPIGNGSLYGAAKNILFNYATNYCKEFDVELVWPRPFFLYGPYEHPSRLISHIIKSLLENKKAIINNGEIYRDYMYVKDTARILLELLFCDAHGAINVSTGQPTKLAEMGRLIAHLINKQELLEIKSPENVTNRVVVADTNKLFYGNNLFPQYSLQEGLKETIDWWENELNIRNE